jgi:hypothetical protein
MVSTITVAPVIDVKTIVFEIFKLKPFAGSRFKFKVFYI